MFETVNTLFVKTMLVAGLSSALVLGLGNGSCDVESMTLQGSGKTLTGHRAHHAIRSSASRSIGCGASHPSSSA